MAESATAQPKKLSAVHLVGLTFFAVCGGDYGIEDAVGAAGPAWTLLGLLVVPWVWSLPVALMTAELGSMMPDMGGPVVWVDRAFGRRVAHVNAIVHIVANFFDTALYPVMFADYLRELHPALRLEGLTRFLLSACMLGVVTALNVVGVDAVARVSTLFTVLVVSPFLALVIAGLPSLDPSAWLLGADGTSWGGADISGGVADGAAGGAVGGVVGGAVGGGEAAAGARQHPAAGQHPPPHHQGVRWGTFLAVLLWNTSGYDSVGALASEVEHPGRDFPRAMAASIVLITLVYLLPVAVGVSLDEEDDLPNWTDGTFAVVAADHVGPWLAKWISLGGALSAFGLLNTLLCAAARIVASASEIGVLPRRLAKIDARSGAPVDATLSLSACLLLTLWLPFAELVKFSMLFYGATTGLEFLALWRLRALEPDALRPYRLPLDDGWPLALFCTPPLALCVLLACVAERASLAIFGGTVALASLTYCLRGQAGEVVEAPPYAPAPRGSHEQETHVELVESDRAPSATRVPSASHTGPKRPGAGELLL